MIRQPEIEELNKLLNNTDSSVIGISRGFLEDVVQEYEKSSISELYNQGLADAWELAKKIVRSPKLVENAQIFLGKNIVGIERESLLIQFFELTPQEALAKLKAYEDSKIKVGDVVAWTDFADDTFNGVVLDFKDNTDNEVVVFNENGGVDVWKIAECKKTGKHIDIQSILEQIGE